MSKNPVFPFIFARAVGRSENLVGLIVMGWTYSFLLIGIGLTDLPRSVGGGSCPPCPFSVYGPVSSLLLDNSKFSGFSPFHLWFSLPVWFWFCAVLALLLPPFRGSRIFSSVCLVALGKGHIKNRCLLTVWPEPT